jgi:quercetin dioxygenase-like cupin family protein
MEDTMATQIERTIYHPIQRDRVTFLKTASETGGALTLVEVELASGGGNDLHYHLSYTERFSPIVGELGVQIGREQRRLRPGESALVERGVVHRFYNPTQETIRFYVELAPGSAGFEQTLYVGYGLACDEHVSASGVPKDLLALGLLTVWSDTRLVGPLALLNPLFGLLARIARWRGVDAALLARYAPHITAAPLTTP